MKLYFLPVDADLVWEVVGPEEIKLTCEALNFERTFLGGRAHPVPAVGVVWHTTGVHQRPDEALAVYHQTH